jgi:hypothetical protein
MFVWGIWEERRGEGKGGLTCKVYFLGKPSRKFYYYFIYLMTKKSSKPPNIKILSHHKTTKPISPTLLPKIL